MEEPNFREIIVNEIVHWPQYMLIDEMLEWLHRMKLRNLSIYAETKSLKAHFVRLGIFTYSRKTKKYRNRYDYPSGCYHDDKHWFVDKQRLASVDNSLNPSTNVGE